VAGVLVLVERDDKNCKCSKHSVV